MVAVPSPSPSLPVVVGMLLRHPCPHCCGGGGGCAVAVPLPLLWQQWKACHCSAIAITIVVGMLLLHLTPVVIVIVIMGVPLQHHHCCYSMRPRPYLFALPLFHYALILLSFDLLFAFVTLICYLLHRHLLICCSVTSFSLILCHIHLHHPCFLVTVMKGNCFSSYTHWSSLYPFMNTYLPRPHFSHALFSH